MQARFKAYLVTFSLLAAVLFVSLERKETGFVTEKYFAKALKSQKSDFPDEFLPILNQRFKFCGVGMQSVAFSSFDDKYVLKFFLSKRLKNTPGVTFRSPLRIFPFYAQKKEQMKREKKEKTLLKALQRYQVAFEKLKEETALLALHFEKSENLTLCLLQDERGVPFSIDLNEYCFVLQKKASLQIEDPTDAKLKLEKLLKKRAEKGFFDVKSKILNLENYGFIEEEAVMIDPGRIAYSEKIEQDPSQEIQKMSEKLKVALSLSRQN